MTCDLWYDDRPMTAAQMFAYLRHRYGDLRAYFLRDRDVIVVPLSADVAEVAGHIEELAARKGLVCSVVCAAWPEYMGPELAGGDEASEFLVIAEIKGKYLQPS